MVPTVATPKAPLLLNLCNFVSKTMQHTNMWSPMPAQQAKNRSAKAMLTISDTRSRKVI